jgi:hypothetical protein
MSSAPEGNHATYENEVLSNLTISDPMTPNLRAPGIRPRYT